MRSRSQAAWDELTAEATAIVDEAGQQGVTLRVMGSAGIRLHCLPPGRLMLATRPTETGSLPFANTIGMVVVAAFAAWAQFAVPNA